jgi:hypothetical protein
MNRVIRCYHLAISRRNYASVGQRSKGVGQTTGGHGRFHRPRAANPSLSGTLSPVARRHRHRARGGHQPQLRIQHREDAGVRRLPALRPQAQTLLTRTRRPRSGRPGVGRPASLRLDARFARKPRRAGRGDVGVLETHGRCPPDAPRICRRSLFHAHTNDHRPAPAGTERRDGPLLRRGARTARRRVARAIPGRTLAENARIQRL